MSFFPYFPGGVPFSPFGFPFGFPFFGRRLFPFFFIHPFRRYPFYRSGEDIKDMVYAVHTVEPGDTMWEIAQRYNIPLPILLLGNPQIQNPHVLQVGEKVYIPKLCSMHCQVMYMEQPEGAAMSS